MSFSPAFGLGASTFDSLLEYYRSIDSIKPFIFAHVVLSYGLLYTKPTSRLRPLLVAIIVLCCFISVRSTVSTSIPGQAGGEYVCGMMMSSSNWLLLAKLSPPNPKESWKWCMNMMASSRWGVSPKMLPVFNRKNRLYTPPKGKFLLQRAWDVAWCAVVIYFLRTYRLNVYLDDFTEVPDGFLHRLTDVSPREWVIRIYVTINAFVMPYCALRGGHALISIIFVACGDAPARYPPLYGSIKEAYTVRRFYIYFWHHLVRKAFTQHSVLVIHDILRFPLNSMTTRYLITVLSFVFSAGMHIFASPETPLKCTVWPQLRYYLSICLAIVVEDVAIRTYQRYLSKGSSTRPTKAVSPSTEDKTATNGAPVKQEAEFKNEKTTTEYDAVQQGLAKKNDDLKESVLAPPSVAIEPTKDFRLTAWNWFGFLWVASVDVWTTSKFLYMTTVCVSEL